MLNRLITTGQCNLLDRLNYVGELGTPKKNSSELFKAGIATKLNQQKVVVVRPETASRNRSSTKSDDAARL